MVKNKTLRKVLSAVFATVTVVTSTFALGAATFAAPASGIPTTQNIVMHKYSYSQDKVLYDSDGNVTDAGAYFVNDGTLQEVPAGLSALDGTNEKVTFTLVDISDMYTTDQLAGTAMTAAIEAQDNEIYETLKTTTGSTTRYDPSKYSDFISGRASSSVDVDYNGLATFENVSTGSEAGKAYIVLETKVPDSVSQTTVPVIIHLPMTVEGTHAKTIHLYGKNQITEVDLDFTKYSESISPGTLLAGATFQLYQYAAGATTPFYKV